MTTATMPAATTATTEKPLFPFSLIGERARHAYEIAKETKKAVAEQDARERTALQRQSLKRAFGKFGFDLPDDLIQVDEHGDPYVLLEGLRIHVNGRTVSLYAAADCPDCDGRVEIGVNNLSTLGEILAKGIHEVANHTHWFRPDSTHPKRPIPVARPKKTRAELLADALSEAVREIVRDEMEGR